MRRYARPVRLCALLALALLLGACAKNGQFDPTDLFSSDMFDTKKKLKGDRKELFPEGVPGASTGVPPELVKGYQAPPEPAVADQSAPGAAAAATADAAETAAEEPPKAKPVARSAPKSAPKSTPRPKKKVARAPASDPIWDQKSANKPTQVDVNRGSPQAGAPAPQPGASPWPDPQAAKAGQIDTVWPAPPPPGTFSR